MSFYLYIRARQEPFPFDLDDQNRQLFSCNYEAEGADIVNWEMDLVTLLAQEGIIDAGMNGNVWIGHLANVPMGDGPFVNIINTGGRSPEKTHNGTLCRYLSAQVIVRALDYEVAKATSDAIWNKLVNVVNQEV